MASKIMNVRAKPLSLKDYLLDDMSSCSSNGFRSFPRRQCCTTVRYLLDIELKNQHHQQYSYFKKNPPTLLKSPSKSALSAFQYVITAVKRLPFSAGRSSEMQKPKKSILPRSISKRIIKKSNTFWRRKPTDREIGRLKSFDELLKEDPASSDRSSISTNDGYNSCWSGNHVTAAAEYCSSGNLKLTEVVSMGENDVVEMPLKDKKVSNGEIPQSEVWGGSTTSGDGSGSITNSSSATTTKEKIWSNEEKEQLSPVSVLDCPFDDEDDEVSSPFHQRLAHVEGTKKKLMKKIQRFESLAELEPLNLTERFALQPESDNESPELPQQCPYESNNNKFISKIEQEEDEDENDKKALELLHRFKHNHPSHDPKIKADKLMLDFFREQLMTNERGKRGGSSFDEELLGEAEVWINGQNPHELFLGWEVKANRQSYINDMEKDGAWKTLDQENMEVTLELETEIFRALLNEMIGDVKLIS